MDPAALIDALAAFEAVALPRTAAYIWPEIESIPLWNAFGSDVYLVWALVGAGVLLFLIAPLIQKLMHGVK